MKNKNYFSFGIMFLFIVCLTGMPAVSNAQQNRGETRQERKAREKQEQIDQYEKAKQMILDSSYVIPFDRVLSRHGELYTGIRRQANYLKVEGDTAILQFRSGHAMWSGFNGLGGYTLKGRIINMEISEKENKHRLFITFTISGNLRNTVAISLNGSNDAAVDISHPQYGRVESLRGEVEAPGQTKLVEGNVF